MMMCVCCPLQELYVNAKEEVTGFLHSAHQWVDMTNVTIQINSTHTVCIVESVNSSQTPN